MENSNNDPIGKALNMNPLPMSTVDKIKVEAHDDSANRDFEFARSNLYDTIETGKDAIIKLSQIADQSQHPRAFEVLATLMKTVVDANKELMTLQKNIREIKDSDSPNSKDAQVINNHLFVGSTAELQKIIQDLNKK
jgi:hypothetical protein